MQFAWFVAMHIFKTFSRTSQSYTNRTEKSIQKIVASFMHNYYSLRAMHCTFELLFWTTVAPCFGVLFFSQHSNFARNIVRTVDGNNSCCLLENVTFLLPIFSILLQICGLVILEDSKRGSHDTDSEESTSLYGIRRWNFEWSMKIKTREREKKNLPREREEKRRWLRYGWDWCDNTNIF